MELVHISTVLTQLLTERVPGTFFLWGKARTARNADNLTATYAPIVYKMWDPLRFTPYGFPRPVRKITLLILLLTIVCLSV